MIMIILASFVILFFADIKVISSEKSGINGKKPVILCTGTGLKRLSYSDNIKDCRLAFEEFGPDGLCAHGCIGLHSCLRACPREAIGKDLKVNYNLCDGCGICIDICPQNLIVMKEYSQKLYTACLTELNSEDAETKCLKSCIKCYICLDICSKSAIYIDDRGIPRIDFNKCDYCLDCLKKCPSEVIIRKYD
jgi:electron transport complex protein RnfB